MITLKSPREIELLKIAGNVVYQAHQYIKPFIKEGITTKEIDRLCEEFIRSKGCTPSFKGCEGFPNALIEAETSGLLCVVSDIITNQAIIDGIAYKVSLIVFLDKKGIQKRKMKEQQTPKD